jgi:hypothetical protein
MERSAIGVRAFLIRRLCTIGKVYLQQTSAAHPALCFMSALVLPWSVAILPMHPVHEWEYPVTRAPGTPLPAGPRSLVTQIGVVLHPSHRPVGCSSIFTGAGFSAGFAADLFQYCGPGPASAAAAKMPAAKIPTEVRIKFRVFIGYLSWLEA